MVPPAQVNHVSSQSIRTRSLAQVTRRSKKSKTAHENLKHESGMSRNAARERYRVQSLRTAFQSLQQCLPSVPPNTKLPKLDVLVLAASYISHLTRILSEHDAQLQDYNILPDDFELIEGTLSTLTDTETRSSNWEKSYLHPVKKWPMRSRLYAGVDKDNSTATECVAAFATQQLIQWN